MVGSSAGSPRGGGEMRWRLERRPSAMVSSSAGSTRAGRDTDTPRDGLVRRLVNTPGAPYVPGAARGHGPASRDVEPFRDPWADGHPGVRCPGDDHLRPAPARWE